MENKILQKLEGLLEFELDEFRKRTGVKFENSLWKKDVDCASFATPENKLDLYMLVGRIKALKEAIYECNRVIVREELK